MWVYRIVIAMFVVLPMVLMGVGAGMAVRQQRKLTTYLPVEAAILSSKVESRRSDKSTTYTPVIEYLYTVDGRQYTGHTVLPIDMSSGQEWADDIVARFVPGTRTTAYHSPTDPADAFLVREYSFFPYLFVLFPMIHLSVGVGLALGTRIGRWPYAPPPAPAGSARTAGWFMLAPHKSLWHKLRMWLVMVLLWYGVGFVALGHYFLNAPRPWGLLATIGAAAFLGLGIIPAIGWARYLLLMRRTSDASVLVNTDTFRLGDLFQVRIVHPIHRDTHVEKYELGLVCDEHTKTRRGNKTVYGQRVDFDKWTTVMTAHDARGGESVDLAETFRLPPDRCATSDGNYPRHVWKIAVRAALRDCPDYYGEFLIHVTHAVRVPFEGDPSVLGETG